MTPWLDRLGGIASATCAVHCLVLSLAPVGVSILGAGGLAHPAVEWAFFASAVLLATAAGVVGFRTHRTWWVPAAFALGLVLLVLGRLSEGFAAPGVGMAGSILGGGMLVTSHVVSAWWTRRCVSCEGATA